ncbi:MAG: four helix bundle protein [Chloroflexi bacterium]|nr:four helix bundle protein [Chloroflexota bacterium]
MSEKFEKLLVWRKSHELALIVYAQTALFPTEERYGISSQLRRSATSIPANIVEGCARQSDGDFARFIDIARGSCGETIYHLILAKDLSLITEDTYNKLRQEYEDVSRMLNGLMGAITKRRRSDAIQQFCKKCQGGGGSSSRCGPTQSQGVYSSSHNAQSEVS